MNINAVSDFNMNGGVSINIKANHNTADSVAGAFEKVVFGNGVPMSATNVSAGGLNGLSESLSSIEEELKTNAQVAKDNLKALFNKLSGAQSAAMDEDGWDLNDMDEEELLTVVDRIKIMLATYCDGYQVMSGDINSDAIKEAVGDNGLAYRIAQKLSGTYIPDTEDNIEEVSQALDMASGLDNRMNEDTMAYIMKNELAPTISNVYMAQHSAVGMNKAEPVEDGQWSQLQGQADRVIEKAGLEVNDRTREEARWLIERQTDLTPENLSKLDELMNYEFIYDEDTMLEACVYSMSEGKQAGQALITGEAEPDWKMVSAAIDILNRADADDVENVTMQYGTLTIARLSFSMTSVEGYMAVNYAQEDSRAVVANNRVLNEARLMLTAYSGSVLVKNGIDLFNEDLSNIVDMLREERNLYIVNEFSDKQAGSISEEDLNKVSGFNEVINELRFMPSAAIGAVVSMGITVTASALYQEGGNLQQKYEQAGQAYDAMSTKVRTDMGDTVKKAVEASASDILEELGLSQTKENVRCINILASNAMEMTEENLYTVKNIDVMLNNIMDDITPQTVLDMIREGMNPMDAQIDVLNEFISERQEDLTDEVERFSEFLYELDKSDGITEDEREQFIGVYKMFNMFKKDAGKAIGALVNQGADVTMGGLVMAINSRKNYDMDITLDVDAGMAEVSGKAAYFETLFSSLGKSLNPQALKKASDTSADMDIEEFAELVEETKEDRNIREQYFNEEISRMRSFTEAEDRVIRILTDYDIPVTFNNLMASEGISKNVKGMFGRFFDEDTEEDVRSDLEKLVEELDSEESAGKAYETLKEDVDRTVRDILEGDETGRLDLRELRCLTEGVKLMGTLSSKHNYVIPFETENGIAAINLKLVSDEGGTGRITVNMFAGDESEVWLECNVTADKIDIFSLSSREPLDEDILGSGLSDLGFETITIRSAAGGTIPDGTAESGDKAPTPMLYRAAKILVKNLIRAESNK